MMVKAHGNCRLFCPAIFESFGYFLRKGRNFMSMDRYLSQKYNDILKKIDEVEQKSYLTKQLKKQEIYELVSIIVALISTLVIFPFCMYFYIKLWSFLVSLLLFIVIFIVLTSTIHEKTIKIKKEYNAEIQKEINRYLKDYNIKVLEQIIGEIDIENTRRESLIFNLSTGIWDILIATIIATIVSKQGVSLEFICYLALVIVCVKFFIDYEVLNELLLKGWTKNSVIYKRSIVRRYLQNVIYLQLEGKTESQECEDAEFKESHFDTGGKIKYRLIYNKKTKCNHFINVFWGFYTYSKNEGSRVNYKILWGLIEFDIEMEKTT